MNSNQWPLAWGEWPISDKTIEEILMKAIISFITITAAAALLNTPVSRAQETAPIPASSPPTQEAMHVVQDEAAKAAVAAQNAQAQAQKAQPDAQVEVAKAQQQMERAKKDMAQASANFGGGGMAGTAQRRREALPTRSRTCGCPVPITAPAGLW